MLELETNLGLGLSIRRRGACHSMWVEGIISANARCCGYGTRMEVVV